MWYDLLIVGNDPAGTQIALMAARVGLSVAVIREPGFAAATTQQSVDALLELADRIESRPAGTARPSPAQCRSEYQKILLREQDLSVRLLARGGVDVVVGEWRWQSDRRVDVATSAGRISVEAGRVVVATGDQLRRPAWMNRSDVRVVAADELFTVHEWPQSAVVAGADRMGLAAGRLLASVGVAVTLIDRRASQVKLPPAVEWDEVFLGKWVVGLTADTHGDTMVVLHDGGMVRCDLAVVALGTEGRAQGTNFRRLGVRADDRGRLWSGSNFETTVQGLFAAGRVVAKAEQATGYEVAVALLRSEFPEIAGKMIASAGGTVPRPENTVMPPPPGQTGLPATRVVPARAGMNTVVFKGERDTGQRPATTVRSASRGRGERAMPAGWRVVG